MTEMIDNYVNGSEIGNKSHNLSADLKKINADTSTDMGAVDLSGFEAPPTKTETLQRNMNEMRKLKVLSQSVNDMDNFGFSDLRQIAKYQKEKCGSVVIEIKDVVQLFGHRIKEMRNTLIRKEYGLQKLLERAAREGKPSWKQTKFAYAISFIKTRIIEIKSCISGLLNNVDKLSETCAVLQNSGEAFVPGSLVDLGHQPNYVCLTGLDLADIERIGTSVEDAATFLRQGGDAWFDLRSQVKCTGTCEFLFHRPLV